MKIGVLLIVGVVILAIIAYRRSQRSHPAQTRAQFAAELKDALHDQRLLDLLLGEYPHRSYVWICTELSISGRNAAFKELYRVTDEQYAQDILCTAQHKLTEVITKAREGLEIADSTNLHEEN